MADQWKKQKKLPYAPANQLLRPFQEQAIRADVLTSNFFLQHNIPLATADHFGHSEMFFQTLKLHQHIVQACNFIKKETLAQVVSCEFCEISKNIFFTEHL